MEVQTASVYGLVDQRRKDIQLVFYVGMSIEPYTRYAQHLMFLDRDTNKAKVDIILDMRKEGMMPLLVIFESDIMHTNAFEREKYWIGHFLSLDMPLTNRMIPSPPKAKRSIVQKLPKGKPPKEKPKTYTEQEQRGILEELNIEPINGMLSSDQVAKVWTKRSETEAGERHEYTDNSVRWRVKSKGLKAVTSLHKRMALFSVEDAFAAKLHPGKGPKKAEPTS